VRPTSKNEICGDGEMFQIRIPGVDFRIERNIVVGDYPAHFQEPGINQVVKLRIIRVTGKNTYTNHSFDEWVLREVVP
jgi:hypothetical protein